MKHWLGRYLAPQIGCILIRLLACTLRIRVQDAGGVFRNPPSHPIIFAFWHNRILMLPFVYEKFWKPRRLHVMISRSRDGQIITEIASKFGIDAVRGSSSKQGVPAYLQLLRALEGQGHDAGVTPDGPRGPRYHVHLGIIHIAQNSGAPIIPLNCHFSHKLELKSWDKFQIPLPFSRCEIHIGHPIRVVSNDEAHWQAAQEQIRRALGIND